MKPRAARSFTHRIEAALAAAMQVAALPAEPRLIVAVSGGADSSATLLALADRAEQHNWSLSAVHVDHRIAPPATRAGFRAAAEAVASRVGAPFRVVEVDAPAGADEQGTSLETAARDARYGALARAAIELEANAIVTGHTADDQAETVLLHLIRGSGLDGLTAMAAAARLPLPDPPAVALLRPLLDVERGETRAFCAFHQLDYVDDPANTDPTYLRNRVRGEVLPGLAVLNPQIIQALGRLARDLRVDRDFLQAQTGSALAEVAELQAEGGYAFSRSALAALPAAIQRRVLRDCVQRLNAQPPTHERLEALQRLLLRGGHRVECGAGIVAEARGDEFRLWRA
jgi:tRNA(Ile)-lysidine synthase